jgi:hypothetical protein
MSTFDLSVVNISKDIYKDKVNAVATSVGCGLDSLSVKLQDADGNIYWGCHAWWSKSDYEAYHNMPIPTEYQEAMSNLYERTVLDGNPQQNFEAALSELGLSIVK